MTHNVAASGGRGRVIATENEPAKAAKAREHWRACGEAVGRVIELREGDLRETLADGLEEVDFLLLDSRPPCYSVRVCRFSLQEMLTHD